MNFSELYSSSIFILLLSTLIQGVVIQLVDVSEGLNLTVAEGSSYAERKQLEFFSSSCDSFECPDNQECLLLKNEFPYCYDPYAFSSPDPRLGCPEGACRNGGFCRKNMCECPSGFGGNNCEISHFACETDPCNSDEVCVSLSDGRHRCSAVCSPSPCENGGTCVVIDCPDKKCLTFRCTCSPGYVDPFCKHQDLCLEQPCLNGGTCTNVCTRSNCTRKCTCTDGYTGEDCSFVVQNPRQDGALACSGRCIAEGCSCVPSCRHENGYYCVNADGFTGSDCSIAPPTVDCEPDVVIIRLPVDFVEEYFDNAAQVSVFATPNYTGQERIDSKCFAEMSADAYMLLFSPSKCGSLIFNGINEVVYKNTLWLNQDTGSDYHYPKPAFDFNCSYQTSFYISASLQPVVDQYMVSVSGALKGKASVGLCKVSTCDRDCPNNLIVRNGIYVVGQKIHVTAKVNIDDEFSTYRTDVVEAYLSCDSSNSLATSNRFVLHRGCERGRSLSATFDQRTTSDFGGCLSFRVPSLKFCSKFFLHLQMRICHPDHFQPKVCSNGEDYFHCATRISKRSLEQDTSTFSVGPIFVVERPLNQAGQESITFKSDNGDSITFNNNKSNNKDEIVGPSREFLIVSVCILSIVLFVAIALLYKRCNLTKRN